jgi:hypothetical protein
MPGMKGQEAQGGDLGYGADERQGQAKQVKSWRDKRGKGLEACPFTTTDVLCRNYQHGYR